MRRVYARSLRSGMSFEHGDVAYVVLTVCVDTNTVRMRCYGALTGREVDLQFAPWQLIQLTP